MKTFGLCILILCIANAIAEKPIPGRFFSRPLFLRQEAAPEAAPYPPSGWKPSGERLILPARQEQEPVPHTVYGPPSTPPPQPGNEYGAPGQQPDNGYPAPEQPQEPLEPSNEYGPPGEQLPQEPDNSYGAPEQPGSGYGPPEGAQGYNYPPPQPTNEYGPPEQPANEYGAPQQPQQPDTSYGAPNGYNPPQENGQIPVEQGASERLRQQQFVQQLPGFGASRFRKPQAQRLQARRPAGKPQRLQQLPQRQQLQQFQRKPQQLRAPINQFAQKQQLYQAPSAAPSPTENNEDVEPVGPNIAVATAVSGEYYVIEPNGRLQRVSYTTKNGKLINGKITSGIKAEEIRNIYAPIYQINEFNQLIRVN